MHIGVCVITCVITLRKHPQPCVGIKMYGRRSYSGRGYRSSGRRRYGGYKKKYYGHRWY